MKLVFISCYLSHNIHIEGVNFAVISKWRYRPQHLEILEHYHVFGRYRLSVNFQRGHWYQCCFGSFRCTDSPLK